VFDGFVEPHNCIPYVHMGFIMQLYGSSLFSMDSLNLRPKARTFLVVLNLTADALSTEYLRMIKIFLRR
jgi:hypothetical protein